MKLNHKVQVLFNKVSSQIFWDTTAGGSHILLDNNM